MQGGGHQAEPAYPGALQVQWVFIAQPANPRKILLQQVLRACRDEGLEEREGKKKEGVVEKEKVEEFWDKFLKNCYFD